MGDIALLAELVENWAIESQEDINCEVDIFDEMTKRGAKLNLLTGEYEWPKRDNQS